MERSLIQLMHGIGAATTRLNVVAHNVANADTVGYKSRDAAFSTVLYDELKNQPGGETAGGNGRLTPEYVRLGLGSRIFGTPLRTDVQGSLTVTNIPTDLAVEGEGYFRLRLPATPNTGPLIVLTRAGSFHLSPEGGELRLVDAHGAYVLDEGDRPIAVPADAAGIVVRSDGSVFYRTMTGTIEATGQRLALYRVVRPDALRSIGDNAYALPAGGGAAQGAPAAGGGAVPAAVPVEAGMLGTPRARVVQGALERSGVDLVQEMTGAMLALRHTALLSRLVGQVDQMSGLADEVGARAR
ncbi:MAG: flagellar hook-basal body protein [Hydrogenibacillus sp.]|nr:flagellar hook-basal body protein [Hydrogenibacillus sp.]